MNHLEVNVGIEAEKKGLKTTTSGDKNLAHGIINKSLSASKLRESFNLNFESMFLDMFTAIPVARAERVEAPKPQERVEAPRAVEPVEKTVVAASPAPVSPDTHCCEARAPEEIRDNSADVKADAASLHKNDKTEGGGEAKTESADKADNLGAKLHESLSEDKKSDIRKKIDDLLRKDGLSNAELLAGVLNIVTSIVGPVKAQETIPAETELGKEDTRKFLKRFLAELDHALAPQEESRSALENSPVPEPVMAKVEETLAKLVAKMDHNVTAADQELVKTASRPAEAVESKSQEAKIERASEAPRAIELRHETVKLQTLEAHVEEKVQQFKAQTGFEAALADGAAVKAKAPASAHLASSAPLGGVAEVSGAARSEGSSQSGWQNSYGQNASTKFMDRAAESKRSEAPRSPQNPIFDQIVQNAKITITGGKSEAVIKLNPDFLGKVEMKIVVEDGKVNVKFTAENNVVQAAITDRIDDLKRSLAQAGLDVENVSVALSGQSMDTDTRDGNDSNRENENGRARRSGAVDDEDVSFDAIQSDIIDGSTVRYVA